MEARPYVYMTVFAGQIYIFIVHDRCIKGCSVSTTR